MSNLNDSVQFLKGVGPKMASLLENLDITDIRSLLFYAPRRYINRNITEKEIIRDGEYVTILAEVIDTGEIRTRRGKTIFNALIKSGDDYYYAKWFNARFIRNSIKKGMLCLFSGKVNLRKGVGEMIHPEFEALDEEDKELIHTGRIVPVYPLTKGLTQKYMRKIVHRALTDYSSLIEETLPGSVIEKYDLDDIKHSLSSLHYPDNENDLQMAIKRFKYEELLIAGAVAAVRRRMFKVPTDKHYVFDSKLLDSFLKNLPFELTAEQKTAIEDIRKDLSSRYPMHRLLMGDVGVGKTLVAVIAMLYAASGGYQSALMAPTEVLAQQHYFKMKELLHGTDINVALITSSVKKNSRQLKGISDGDVNIVIGTHALIEDEVNFNNLKLVIIDEQHRFGVAQRNLLRKKGIVPDYLLMTATPIPRSMTMAMYGDMDITTIAKGPAQRKPIKTKWIAGSEENTAYDFASKLMKNGERCFVICPAIEETENEIESVEKNYNKLIKGRFSEFNVGKIYSKMKPDEKEQAMIMLKEGNLDALVGTTVIEVGIDVRDATCMIILGAERFGLSQLHQLRGRVGRGDKQSYCFLVSGDDISDESVMRLKTLASTNDGFKISEMDLKIRGPGEFWGTRQHGMPIFRFADFFEDRELLKQAFSDAAQICKADPNLLKNENKYVNIQVKRIMQDELKDI